MDEGKKFYLELEENITKMKFVYLKEVMDGKTFKVFH